MSLPSRRAVLRRPEFLRYLWARMTLMLAVHLQGVAVAWQIYSLTKDPVSLGLIGFASVLPTLTLALFAGHATDRFSRRNLLLLSQLGALLCQAGLLGVSLLGANWSVGLQSGLIYGSVFVGGAARAFLSPSQFALFGEIVPVEERVEGMAWSSSVWQIAAAAGPALGGLLFSFTGPAATYLFGLSSILVAILATASIKARPPPTFNAREPLTEGILVGLRFIFREKLLLSALSLDMFAVLFGGAVALLPVFADRLGVGAQGLGLLRAAPFVGATLMALLITQRPPRRYAGRMLLSSVAGFGACIIAFGLSTSYPLSIAILALSGAFDQVSVVVRGTLLQLLTPDSMRGRVSAVNQVFIASSNEIGEMESGLTAKIMGTVPAVLFGGTMTLLVVAVIASLSRRLRRLDIGALEAARVAERRAG